MLVAITYVNTMEERRAFEVLRELFPTRFGFEQIFQALQRFGMVRLVEQNFAPEVDGQ